MPPKAAEQPKASLPEVEAKFTAAADRFFEKALDLNVSQGHTAKLIGEVMNIRHKLLGLYGVAPDPKWKPGAMVFAAPGMAAAAGPVEDIKWVAKLYEVMAKTLRRSLNKGEVNYVTEAADETGKSFISTLTCELFSAEYKSPSPCPSKKAAEHAAAQVAMEAEYPDAYRALASSGSFASLPQKRKAPGEPSAGPPEGKSQLSHFVQMILQRSVTKEDIVYDTTEAEGNCKCTVTLPQNDNQSFKGEGPTKKDAEMAAAKAACAVLAPIAAPLIEEHKAKKAKKMEEANAKRKEKLEERKAAREAAKAAKEAAA